MANSEIMQQALEIARAQAGVRPMTASEVALYVNDLARALEAAMAPEETRQIPSVEPRNSIGESSVVCLECGKKFKVIGSRHLRMHGLTPNEYREKWGLRKDVSLTAKSLVRMRRKKMQEMRLWERKGK